MKKVLNQVKIWSFSFTALLMLVNCTDEGVVEEDVIEPTEVAINNSELVLMEGEKKIIEYTITPVEVSDDDVTWGSLDEDIVFIDQEGKIEGVSVGETEIYIITSNELRATSKITVNPILGNSIKVSESTLDLIIGDSSTLSASVLPATVTNNSYTWSSSDLDVVTVSDKGVLNALTVGTAIITATTDDGTNLSDTCTITVNPLLTTSVLINYVDIPILEGKSVTLKATAYPENATDLSVSWESSDVSILEVSDLGVATGIKSGIAQVRVNTKDGNSSSPWIYYQVYADSDRDGIRNTLDSCDNTPLGESIDSNGCALSQKDSDGDGLTDDLDFNPINYFERYDTNSNNLADYYDTGVVISGKTKTILQIDKVVTSGGESSVTLLIIKDSDEFSLQFRYSSNNWVLSNSSGWNGLNVTAFSNSILSWVSPIPEINTVSEFANFFNGSFTDNNGFSPIGKLKYVSIEED